jgi:pilus assembly protein FimV
VRDQLPLVGGGLAALLLLALLVLRRLKARRESVAQTGEQASVSLFGTTGAQNIDTTQNPMNSDFGATGAHPVESGDVDPLGEADLFISYGRLAQAEEILRDAIRITPDRLALRTKLLEVLAAREDAATFEAEAQQLKIMTQGQGEDWERAVALGRGIDPDNPLYAAAESSSAPAPAGGPTTPAAAAPAVPALGVPAGAAMLTDLPSPIGAATPVQAESADENTDLLATATSPMDLDFDLDMTLPEDSTPQASPAGASEEQTAPPAPVTDTLSMVDFDLTRSEIEAVRAATEAVESALPDSPLAEPELAASTAEPKPEQTEADEAPLTLSLDLNDLGAEAGAPISSPAPLAAQPEVAALDSASDARTIIDPDADFDDTGTVADISAYQEMATKLDLAAAYVEIGDKEGARELLEEVLSGGSADQQARAREMLDSLG